MLHGSHHQNELIVCATIALSARSQLLTVAELVRLSATICRADNVGALPPDAVKLLALVDVKIKYTRAAIVIRSGAGALLGRAPLPIPPAATPRASAPKRGAPRTLHAALR